VLLVCDKEVITLRLHVSSFFMDDSYAGMRM